MHAYALAEWSGFATAEVGAAAALTGLLFVAVSINLARILAFPKLPARAAETLVVLLLALVASSLVLLPQNVRFLGAEVGAIGLGVGTVTLTVQVRHGPDGPNDPWSWYASRVGATLVPALCYLLGGIPAPSAGAAACTGSPLPRSSPSSAPSTTPGFSSSRSSANKPSLRLCRRTSGGRRAAVAATASRRDPAGVQPTGLRSY